MTTTLDRIKTILARDYRADADQLTIDTPLESIGVDSLAAVELLWSVEDEFGIKLPAEPPSLATLGDVVRFIDAIVAGQPPQPELAPAP